LGIDADKLHKQQQKTLALIKPDAMQANYQQAIIDKIVSSGFTILQQKQIHFSLDQACLFYREHEHKAFYPQLTEWMSR
jgi:nucleoside diphosphate kinase